MNHATEADGNCVCGKRAYQSPQACWAAFRQIHRRGLEATDWYKCREDSRNWHLTSTEQYGPRAHGRLPELTVRRRSTRRQQLAFHAETMRLLRGKRPPKPSPSHPAALEKPKPPVEKKVEQPDPGGQPTGPRIVGTTLECPGCTSMVPFEPRPEGGWWVTSHDYPDAGPDLHCSAGGRSWTVRAFSAGRPQDALAEIPVVGQGEELPERHARCPVCSGAAPARLHATGLIIDHHRPAGTPTHARCTGSGKTISARHLARGHSHLIGLDKFYPDENGVGTVVCPCCLRLVRAQARLGGGFMFVEQHDRGSDECPGSGTWRNQAHDCKVDGPPTEFWKV